MADTNLIIAFEAVFASIAFILGILSFTTLRAIRHLGVGKSFWIPVFGSSIFFLFGSVATILNETGFSLTNQTFEIGQVSRILGLVALLGGIFSYSRRVKASLTEEFLIPERLVEENLQIEASIQEEGAREKINGRNGTQKSSGTEAAVECQYQLGYLRTLPRNASIPDECLRCDRIVECKHSLVNTSESFARTR